MPAVVYLHGGGWVLGDVDNVDAACRDLASAAGCVVLNVGYRLAPEHPFPAAVDDAWAVVASAAREPERYGIVPGAVAVAATAPPGTSPPPSRCSPATAGCRSSTSCSSTR